MGRNSWKDVSQSVLSSHPDGMVSPGRSNLSVHIVQPHRTRDGSLSLFYQNTARIDRHFFRKHKKVAWLGDGSRRSDCIQRRRITNSAPKRNYICCTNFYDRIFDMGRTTVNITEARQRRAYLECLFPGCL